MITDWLAYPATAGTLLVAVLVFGKLLRVGSSSVKMLSAAGAYLALVGLTLICTAGFDPGWLDPSLVFARPLAIGAAGALLLTALPVFIAHVSVWKAVVIAAVAHAAMQLALELVILGF